MAIEYFIRADVFGKTKYWDHIDGLTKAGRLKGYDVHQSVREANKTIKKLKSIFHSGIKYEVIPRDELPFIKKQILARNRGERICFYCGSSNGIKRKFCKKCRKYQG